jgi:small-conductance mechanosensitive channel
MMNIAGLGQIATQGTGSRSLSEVTVVAKGTAKESTATSSDSQDKVNISSAGRKALADDVGSQLHRNNSAQTSEAQEAAEEDTSGMSEIDKKIKELQNKLKELQQELQQLNGDDSEAAEIKRKLLQDQIAAVSGQLVALIKEKTHQDKNTATEGSALR